MSERLTNILVPILAVVTALLIGAIIIFSMGEDPIAAYGYLISGAFGSQRGVSRTLLEATPLIFTGLSVLFAYKAGMFNIGGQGQVILGGITASFLGTVGVGIFPESTFIVVLASGIAGFLWAGIAGFLKARIGVHEVISTIMLNYIAINLSEYVLNGPLKEGGTTAGIPQTAPVAEGVRYAKLIEGSHVALNTGFIVALIMAVLIYILFKWTVLGYEIKAVGLNKDAAENAGINIKWITMFSLGMAGFLAALGGAERVLGGVTQYRYGQGTMANYGFDGIAVALLGKNHPFGVVLGGILFAALRAGGNSLQMNTTIPSQIIIILQALIILFVASENMFKNLLKRKGVR